MINLKKFAAEYKPGKKAETVIPESKELLSINLHFAKLVKDDNTLSNISVFKG
mgnify:CR=1 FL=1